MLKALELIGFKSFADKTRFAFPPAITVVVGPNGSGKSNIVDAIKWVLGAQSVKSLRGKEMIDVIFNGSGTRRPMNTAEVTLTFDNSNRRLAIDTPEVAITRRVYRSGEGEYLINRQPCRLRDIRDLFSGTGIATDAYSVIEQGKVDVLLQSSARDRRVIFEEAAGISRFKAKKLEAERRLVRVDQNLLRLSDIVDEVESRLRSVRLQAAKARRYRDYTCRLQSLRTHVGLTDWRALSETFAGLEDQLRRLAAQRDELTARQEVVEADSLSLEAQISASDEAIHSCEARTAQNRESIATAEATIEHAQARCRDADEEIARHRRQLADMGTRAGDVQQRLQETRTAWEASQAEHQRLQGRLDGDEQTLTRLAARLEEMDGVNSCRRTQHMELMRSAATLGNVVSAATSRESSATEVCNRCDEQRNRLEQQQTAITEQLGKHRQHLDAATEALRKCEAQVRAGQAELTRTRHELSGTQKQLAELQGRHTRASERAAVLAELERRLEGLGAGVKQVLAKARQADDGPYRQIQGLLADLLHVKVETAPLVEVALGGFAQYVVLAPGNELIDALARESGGLQGRVGFLCTDAAWPTGDEECGDLVAGAPGVLGRADRFVETSKAYVPLVRRLLGQTYFVETLAQALVLAKACRRGLSFVTLRGELVTGDGKLLVGPQHTTTGLISRRSELRALKEQIAELDGQITATEATLKALEANIAAQDGQLRQLGEEHTRRTRDLGEQRLRTASAEQQLEQLGSQWTALTEEAEAAASQQQSAAEQIRQAQLRLAETDTQLADLEGQITRDTQQLDTLRADHAQRQRETTACRVELAKSEQRLDSLRCQLAQFQRERDERSQALAENRCQLEKCQQRAREAQQRILRTESEVAELYLQKEQVAAQEVVHRNQREALWARRRDCVAVAQQIRQKVHALEKQCHEKELEADRVRLQRETLAERMREDYDIELADLSDEPSDEARRQREEVEQEIAELRQKINHIGSVNLEALDELEELETRFGSLSSQHADLQKAKAALEQIIVRINADSRRLFAETLSEVRTHFQSLFRKLFGGGQANIVLEEGADVDILESGIEIVARPPGKEPRSISLLSGGEKTLTCVALLLAIFRSRPSPFCVLDEVDAALDEANIERFIGVLTEFLASTQFIVVTHSKKTMTAANTLYGVTMQESGVSKRVSVRFDDVHENGEIRESAPAVDLGEEASEGATARSDDGTKAA